MIRFGRFDPILESFKFLKKYHFFLLYFMYFKILFLGTITMLEKIIIVFYSEGTAQNICFRVVSFLFSVYDM